jgi:hypothetical protein
MATTPPPSPPPANPAPGNPPPPERASDRLMRWASASMPFALFGFFAAIGLGVLYFLGISIARPGTLQALRDIETARGLITFLVVVGTVAMAIILSLAAILMSRDEYKERFGAGKEVLTIMIGVLGTIVGFYFGTSAKDSSTTRAQSASPYLASLTVSPEQLVPKGTVTITGSVAGGKPPYRYVLSFTPSLIPATKRQGSDLRRPVEEARAQGEVIVSSRPATRAARPRPTGS